MLRAVEEAAFGEKDLRVGRRLARAGAVGAITVSEGGAVAAVSDGQDAFTVEVTVPVLDAADAAAFVELVAAESGRIGALLAGQLPHSFVEAVEEAGVELLPYGGELGSACSCDAWLDPCPHALAVLTQLAWLIQADPFVLIHLRGLARERVLRDLHRLVRPPAVEAPLDAESRGDSTPAGPTTSTTWSSPRTPPSAPPGSCGWRARSTPGDRRGRRAGATQESPRAPWAMSRSTSCICGSGSRPLCGVELSRPKRTWARVREASGLRVASWRRICAAHSST